MPSVSIVADTHNPQNKPPLYNPLVAGRRCGHCGSRTDWYRLDHGGWVCSACSDLPEIKHDPRELRHVCTVACAIGGAA